jgi:hypothetical protein
MTETYTTEDFVRAMHGATVSAYSSGAETYSAASPTVPEGEFERFEDLAAKLTRATRAEIDTDHRPARDRGQEMTAEIEADPDEVARLRLSRQQARGGKVHWDREDEDSDR